MRAVMHPECGGWSVVKSLESLAGRPLEKQYFRVCHLEASREGWTGLRGLLRFLHQSPHRCSGSRSRRGLLRLLPHVVAVRGLGAATGTARPSLDDFAGGGLRDGRGGSPEFDTKRQRKPDGAGHVRIFRAASIAVWVIPPHHVQRHAATERPRAVA